MTGAAILTDVLCGIDGTRSAYEAVRQAASLAGPNGKLTLLAICDVRGSGQQRSAVLGPVHARRSLDRARRIAKEAGVDSIPELEPGGPVVRIMLERASEHGLLALGAPSMSRLGHLLIGGVATAAAHRLPTSLLVARRPPAASRSAERIVVASDALSHSDRLVDFAIDLARARSSSLVLVHALRAESASHPTRVAAQARRVADALGERSSVRIEPGRAHASILKVAAEERASLIVMSSRRVSGPRALGSVSERVVHNAPCSVLLIRPKDLGA
jgi:nucleotide-binding universal stress UspA family protein